MKGRTVGTAKQTRKREWTERREKEAEPASPDGSGGKGHGRARRTQGPFCPGRRRKQDWISYKGQATIRQGGMLEVSGSWTAASSVIQSSSRAGIL